MQTKLQKIFLALIFFGVFFFAKSSYGATYYVSQSGVGNGNGLSLTNAASVANHNAKRLNLQPDDIVYLCGNITSEVVIPSSGTLGHHIVYRGDCPGYPAVLDGHDTNMYGINGKEVSHITVHGVTAHNATYTGIMVGCSYRVSTDWLIEDCITYDTDITGSVDEEGHGIQVMASDVIVQRCTSYHNKAHGIHVFANGHNISNVLIQNCNVYNNMHTNIDVRLMGGGSLTDVTLRYNLIYCDPDFTVGNNGIYSNGVAAGVINNLFIYSNAIYENTARGCQIDPYVDNVKIYNNSFYNNDWDEIYINNDALNVDIKNNIALETRGTYGIMRLLNRTNKQIDYNNWQESGGIICSYGESGQAYSSLASWRSSGFGFDEHSLSTNPLYLNASSGDFRLNSSSQCIGRGYNLGSDYQHDIQGNSQQIPWTMGAYIEDNDETSPGVPIGLSVQ